MPSQPTSPYESLRRTMTNASDSLWHRQIRPAEKPSRSLPLSPTTSPYPSTQARSARSRLGWRVNNFSPACHVRSLSSPQKIRVCLSRTHSRTDTDFVFTGDHYRSDHHRYNMKRRVASLPPVSVEIFNQKVLERRQETAVMLSPKGSTCEVCKYVVIRFP